MYDYKVQSQITGQQFLTEWLLREFKMDSLWTTVFITIEPIMFRDPFVQFFGETRIMGANSDPGAGNPLGGVRRVVELWCMTSLLVFDYKAPRFSSFSRGADVLNRVFVYTGTVS